MRTFYWHLVLLAFALILGCSTASAQSERLLYVACPGIRANLEYGGHGILVFDMDKDFVFKKRIPAAGLGKSGNPENVKGVCASAALGRIYVSTISTLSAYDLKTDKLLWEKSYEGGCDRMSMTPDGLTVYLPSFEKDHWHVVDGTSGEVTAVITPKSGAHNTVASRDGKEVYLAGLRSPILTVADTQTKSASRTIGPFGAEIRPFTVNADSTRCYCCVNDLLGFEVGDLKEGKKLFRVEVPGVKRGPVLRHGCPSHGIGLTPDGKELWVCDAFNKSLHIFDATKEPPAFLASVKLGDEPGWVTFSLDGKLVLPSTGEVIDAASRKIVHQLRDENGTAVQSEKMVEVQFTQGRLTAVGDQFGIGRK